MWYIYLKGIVAIDISCYNQSSQYIYITLFEYISVLCILWGVCYITSYFKKMKKLTIAQDEPNKKTRVKRPIRLFTNPVQKGEKNNITLKIL